MNTIQECMTTNVETVSSNQSIKEAAAIMSQSNVGSIPVVDNGQLKGIITDRDITIRSTSEGRDSDTPVSHVMTTNLVSGHTSMTAAEAAKVMAQHQIRRLPIVENNQLVGIVALGDLATDQMSDEAAGAALTNISEPTKTN
ncbi:CBS domain-containing protein [Metabacillus sediminilitoris]|uniref:CBS domain-containing protein n=2 Tax=Metabacillus sediminilitoris TaxID=2567941 RepID=A0A4S4C375_9BACI|nr:CBS domain-containing protein [Metabacillus sediminilitoris]QGQ44424.1 CBS domain-containing protein [Metabacillus sediminilitoris]THF80047.1 CBS domain-containing protein [Metabacillus sediminilitoris]